MVTPADKLRIARESQNPPWSQTDLAREMHRKRLIKRQRASRVEVVDDESEIKLIRARIANYERGSSLPTPEFLDAVANLFGIQREWFDDAMSRIPVLLAGNSKSLQAVAFSAISIAQIEYIGLVPNNDLIMSRESPELFDIDGSVFADSRFAMRMSGSGGWPVILQGDVLVFEPDVSPALGLIVLAESEDGNSADIRILDTDGRGRSVLRVINEESGETPLEVVRATARLVAVIRKQGVRQTRWHEPLGLSKKDLETS